MLSTEWTARLEALRAELRQRTEEHGTIYKFEFSEEQVGDLASGYVPQAVKAMCLSALDWQDEDRRRAERPVRGRKGKQ